MLTVSGSTNTFQLSLNKTTGMFSMSSTEGPLLSKDFKITVPADTEEASIRFSVPDWLTIIDVQTTILEGSDSPAVIILKPPPPSKPFQSVDLFKFNVGNTFISLSVEDLDENSITFKNTNGAGGDHNVRFGVWLRLADDKDGCIYQTRDPQIDDVNEGGP